MPWKGPGRRYYYTARRVGKRIVYQYWGSGETAALIAELDALDRQRRQHVAQIERDRYQSELDKCADPPELLQFFDLVDQLVKAELVQAGYHQHKRQWRKKRDKQSA